MRLVLPVLFAIFLFGSPYGVCAQHSDSKKNNDSSGLPDSMFNLPTRTMGGMQWWSDLVHFHGYRIQKHVVTGHHRLLDEGDVRRAWGSLAGCQKKLQEIAREKNLHPVKGRVLIVLHGLTRTRGAMNSIAKYVADHSGTTVVNFGYASTRTSIEKHADALASVIDHLPEVETIDFLGHSMGSIVVRHYLHKHKPEGDPRFHRMVMLAPPNQGSRLATILQDNLIFKSFWGRSGQELSRHWSDIESRLAIPDFEFGIIAGSRPDDATLDNPLFSEKNDLVVTVEETRLQGATDFLQMDLFHSTMMNNAEVHLATLNFLQKGFFISATERNPIASESGTGVGRE